MLDSETLARWVGHAVHDPSGKRIGSLIQVYTTTSGEPLWLVVKRGTMTTRTDLVPASAASVGSAGLEVSVDAPRIHGSPSVKDRHHLTVDDERALNAYYGIGAVS